MTEIEIYLSNLQRDYERVLSPQRYAVLVSMRQSALGLLRVLDGSLGITGAARGVVVAKKTVILENTEMRCELCDFVTTKGIMGMRSHVGIKHRTPLHPLSGKEILKTETV